MPFLGVVAAACDNGGKDQNTPVTTSTVSASTVSPEVTKSPVISPTAIRTVEATPTSVRTPTTTPTATRTETVQNGALVLDGRGDYVEYDGARYKFKAPLTIEARITLNNTIVGGDAILAKGDKTEAIAFFARLTSCPQRGMAVHIGNSDPVCGPKVQENVPVDVAMTFDGKEVVFYENGKAVASIPWNAEIPIEDGPLFIGVSPNSPIPFLNQEHFNGKIDYVRVSAGVTPANRLNLPLDRLGMDRQRVIFDAEYSENLDDAFNRVAGIPHGNAHIEAVR